MQPQKRRKKKKKQVSLEGWRPRSREEKLTPGQQAARDRWLMHKQELEDEVRRERAARVDYLRGEVRRFLAELDLPIREIWNGISVMGDDFVFTDVELKERNASSVLNRIAAAKLVQPMLQLVKDELGGRGLPYTALPSASGIRLLSAGNQTALVKATCVEFADKAAAIHDNFLQPGGESWEELRRQLRRFAVAEVRTELPSSVSVAALSQASEATRRLRSERTLEYGHSVILREADRTVRFDPIPEHGAVEVPFAYEETGGHLSGAIRLKAPGEVLALAIADRSDDPAIIASAWLFALLGYADLTCVVLEEPVETLASTGASGRAGSSPLHGPTRRTPPTPRTHSLGFRAPLPTSLTPTHSTRQHLASYVTGHKRHLSHGRQASLEARKRAEHIGILLAQHETWVRPHARGVPDDAVLVFDWKAAPRSPTQPPEPEHLIA